MVRAALLAFALLLGCSREQAPGEPCGDHSDCAKGRCVAGIAGPDPVCTPTCGADSECPEGWSCSVATDDNVLVCRPGTATPFGY